ncbi:MAG: zinc-dependent peptidase [Bacteroidetes bacterium]|nr:zinc-dependent peptidase [Bacteroidota bacterium]
MPPDSTYILENIADTAGLPDSIRILYQQAMQSVAHEASHSVVKPYSNQGYDKPGSGNIVFIIATVLCFFVLMKYLRFRFLTKKISRIFEEKRSVYHDILSEFNPYYKSLETDSQDRFIRRTIFFMEAKEFQYVGIEEEEKIPLLISAAAIQLTFGLKHYMLNYFKTIYVMKENYRYGLSAVPFEGHVNDNGIYLSWNNFIREYSDYSDGENVGLHEMAHALVYVNFTVQDGMDNSFRSKFYEFSPIARPIFARMQAGETNILNKYAATNYEEFWAVCVEAFFERPFPFREQMPDLYFSLCRLLNQDPTTKSKILDPTVLRS